MLQMESRKETVRKSLVNAGGIPRDIRKEERSAALTVIVRSRSEPTPRSSSTSLSCSWKSESSSSSLLDVCEDEAPSLSSEPEPSELEDEEGADVDCNTCEHVDSGQQACRPALLETERSAARRMPTRLTAVALCRRRGFLRGNAAAAAASLSFPFPLPLSLSFSPFNPCCCCSSPNDNKDVNQFVGPSERERERGKVGD